MNKVKNSFFFSLSTVISTILLSQSAWSAGSFSVDGSMTTTTLKVGGLNCTGNKNGGALTTDASGNVTCSDDVSGGVSALLDGTSMKTLKLSHIGSDGGSNHAILSDKGYYLGLVGDGSIRGNIIYFQSNDCSCANVNCSGEAFVAFASPGEVIRSTFSSDSLDVANIVFYVEKAANFDTSIAGNLAPGTSTGSRRVTSACQANQNLTRGFPVIINDPATTGINTNAAGDLDHTTRHFVTFPDNS